MTAVVLRAGPYELTLYPEIGGSIGRFTWQHDDGVSVDLLRPMAPGATNSEAAGCFPLFPFSNRIRHGHFTFDGREIFLPRNTSGPHVEHGHGWQRHWQIAALDERSAILGFTHDPTRDGTWPFAYQAEQHFLIDDAGLTITLRARNLGERVMPLGLGLHPYFPRTPLCRLQTKVSGFWETDAEVMPTRHVAVPPALDPALGLAMQDIVIDNVCTGFAGKVAITWPEAATTLTMLAGPALRQLVLYVPDAATQAAERASGIPPYFCAEPVSNITDAFNLAGTAETGLIELAPQAELSVTIRFAAAAVR